MLRADICLIYCIRHSIPYPSMLIQGDHDAIDVCSYICNKFELALSFIDLYQHFLTVLRVI